jgi:hypothetical protein
MLAVGFAAIFLCEVGKNGVCVGYVHGNTILPTRLSDGDVRHTDWIFFIFYAFDNKNNIFPKFLQDNFFFKQFF